MNIALFASSFFPNTGGVEELVRQLAHEYSRRGMSPIVITSRWPRSLPQREVYEHIPIYRLPMRIPESSIKSKISYHLTQAPSRQRIQDILRWHRIDLIHVQCVSTNGHYALHAHRDLHLPLVVTTQGERTMDASGLYRRSEFVNRALRDLLAAADHITACSKNTLTDLQEWYGTPFDDKASVIYNGVRVADFSGVHPYPHRFPYILAIGRIVPQKGFDVLLRAFARSGTAKLDLLIAGDGPERQPLEALARTLGLEGRVHFIGTADRATTAMLFKGCRFFVLPSRLEPMGIVNLEAMASGKALIASSVGGVPEIVRNGRNGLLVPPEDSDALATAIRSLAGNHALQARLGRDGRASVDAFDWSNIADQYVSIYRTTLSSPRSATKAA